MDKLTFILVAILASVIFSLLISFPAMLLWNHCLVPAISTLKEVGWLQMWGIALLFNFLFKTSLGTKEKA